jgi:hypothetical protein
MFLRVVLSFLIFMSSARALLGEALSTEHLARVADKISLRMVGTIATPAQREAVSNGTMSPREFAEALKGDTRFLASLAKYWMRELKITAPVDFPNVTAPGIGATSTLMRPGRNATTDANKSLQWRSGRYSLSCVPLTAAMVATATPEVLNFYRKRCCSYIQANSGIVADPLVKVTPWWAPDKQVDACAELPLVCGPQLAGCFPGERRIFPGEAAVDADLANKYNEGLIEGFTAEPGYLIGRVIRDALAWDEVVTGRFTMANGMMQHFLKTPFANAIVAAAVTGAWKNEANVVTLNNATNPLDGNWYVVDHHNSGAHAGVLSTMAFQKAYNGHYAKANAAMETFLCRSFTAPHGSVIPSSVETEPARKPFCSTCHSILDPMAQHFARWPRIGSTNFLYDSGSGISSAGRFMGFSDSDTVGLGRTFTKLPDFKTCAVNHAFRFLMGRSMSVAEQAEYMSPFVQAYDVQDRRLWQVYLEIIQSDVFLGVQGE